MSITVRTGDNSKIGWVFELQKPPIIPLSRWYVRDAEEVAWVEHLNTGFLDVRISTPAKVKAENKEGLLQDLIPRGSWALVDFREAEVIYSEKIGFPKELWSWLPKFQKEDTNDFKVQLAGSSKGEFLMVHGSHRNLVLTLWAQVSTWGLRGGARERQFIQTTFGRALATSLYLHKYSLPPVIKYQGRMNMNFLCTLDKRELPVACLRELEAIDTSPPVKKDEGPFQEVIPGLPKLDAPKEDPKDKDDAGTYIDLAFLQNIEDGDWDLELVAMPLPIDVHFEDHLTDYPYLEQVEKMSLVDEQTVSVISKDVNPSQKFIEMLEVLLDGYNIQIRSKSGMVMFINNGGCDETVSY